MGHISAIRAEKISTNLTLIATVFLPITFLASAFGMNFEKHGDYTMEILNSPQVQWMSCIIYVMLFMSFSKGEYIFLKVSYIINCNVNGFH